MQGTCLGASFRTPTCDRIHCGHERHKHTKDTKTYTNDTKPEAKHTTNFSEKSNAEPDVDKSAMHGVEKRVTTREDDREQPWTDNPGSVGCVVKNRDERKEEP